MEKVIRKVSFKDAEKLDMEFWSKKSITEKIEVLTRLRFQYHGGARLKKVVALVRYDR